MQSICECILLFCKIKICFSMCKSKHTRERTTTTTIYWILTVCITARCLERWIELLVYDIMIYRHLIQENRTNSIALMLTFTCIGTDWKKKKEKRNIRRSDWDAFYFWFKKQLVAIYISFKPVVVVVVLLLYHHLLEDRRTSYKSTFTINVVMLKKNLNVYLYKALEHFCEKKKRKSNKIEMVRCF